MRYPFAVQAGKDIQSHAFRGPRARQSSVEIVLQEKPDDFICVYVMLEKSRAAFPQVGTSRGITSSWPQCRNVVELQRSAVLLASHITVFSWQRRQQLCVCQDLQKTIGQTVIAAIHFVKWYLLQSIKAYR